MNEIKGYSIQNGEPTPDNPVKIESLELEEKYIVHLTDKEYRDLVDIIRKEAKQEFEQKVKGKIKELRLSGGSDGKDDVENLALELIIEVLQELLEDK